jgi:hypothetical protein
MEGYYCSQHFGDSGAITERKTGTILREKGKLRQACHLWSPKYPRLHIIIYLKTYNNSYNANSDAFYQETLVPLSLH